jgi:hypothetical protein
MHNCHQVPVLVSYQENRPENSTAFDLAAYCRRDLVLVHLFEFFKGHLAFVRQCVTKVAWLYFYNITHSWHPGIGLNQIALSVIWYQKLLGGADISVFGRHCPAFGFVLSLQ